MTRYVFWYFGSPVFYLTGQELGPQPPRHAALIEGTGALFVLACVALGLRTAWTAWRMRGHMPSAQCFCVALVGFLAYLGGSAFGTAGGRLLLGLPQALTSRYATPVLLGWCALAVAGWLQWALHRPVDARAISPWPSRIATALTCGLCLWLLAYQARPLVQPRDFLLARREMAALAAGLDVADQPVIGTFYYSPPHALFLAQMASARRVGLYGTPPFADLRASLGTPPAVIHGPDCPSRWMAAERIPDVPGWLRVYGHIEAPPGQPLPRRLHLFAGGTLKGVALTWQPLPLFNNGWRGGSTLPYNFHGYLQATDEAVLLQAANGTCAARLPPPPAE